MILIATHTIMSHQTQSLIHSPISHVALSSLNDGPSAQCYQNVQRKVHIESYIARMSTSIHLLINNQRIFDMEFTLFKFPLNLG